MYGPNDNYDPEKSHVLPAIIRRIHQSHTGGTEAVFWGTGNPRREFIYSLDVARIAIWAIETIRILRP
jgi:GDP-L-fucose synthase